MMIVLRCRSLSLWVLCAVFALAPPVQAAKEKFERTKPHVNVGTIGHVDHGKTTLTAAITKVTRSKLLSSSARPWDNEVCSGETHIASSPFVSTLVKHADFVAGVRQDLIFTSDDMTRFILTGTSAPNGIAQMDGAILVVAAADGPLPETREHVLLARQVGVPAPVVYINDIGVVNLDLRERATSQTLDLLADVGYDPADARVFAGDAGAVVRGEGSAADIASIEELVEAVVETVPLPERPLDQSFLMAIEDVFSIRGRGTSVTGTIARGAVKVGDTLEVVGGEAVNRPALVEEIVIVDGVDGPLPLSVDAAEPGDAVQLLLGVDRATVGDGLVIAEPGSIMSINSMSASIYVPTEAEGGAHKPFFTNYRPQFYFRTQAVTGTVSEIEGADELLPGSIGTIHVEFDQYVPHVPAASIPICDPDTGETNGVGMIVD